MTDEDRGRAADLMRSALAVLDALGEQRASLHLQLALDLLDERNAAAGMGALPTCH